eukprot:gb/GECG01010211.1/.p1 GENE.gb/GECG01010211.1/~~gb/GECG01010211.1/.p1  ORF type:complete len:362 (+),score=40.33 gb/GECG01010211.1/:1-1086(+)
MAHERRGGPEWPPSYDNMHDIVEQAATIGSQYELVFSAAIAHILQNRGYKGVTNERTVHVGLGDEIVRWEHRGQSGDLKETIDLRVDVCIEHESGTCVIIEVKTDNILKKAAVKQALTYWRHMEIQGTKVEKAFVVTFIKSGQNTKFDFRKSKDTIADLEKQDVAIEELAREDVPVDKLIELRTRTEPESSLSRRLLERIAGNVAQIGHPTSDKPFAICISYLLHCFGFSVTFEQPIPVKLNGSNVTDTEGKTQYMKGDILVKESGPKHTLIKVVYAQKVTQLQVKRALSCRQQLSNQGNNVSKIYFVLFEVDGDQNEHFKGNISERFFRSSPTVREIVPISAEELAEQFSGSVTISEKQD